MRAGLDPFSFLVVSIAGWLNLRQHEVDARVESRPPENMSTHSLLRKTDSDISDPFFTLLLFETGAQTLSQLGQSRGSTSNSRELCQDRRESTTEQGGMLRTLAKPKAHAIFPDIFREFMPLGATKKPSMVFDHQRNPSPGVAWLCKSHSCLSSRLHSQSPSADIRTQSRRRSAEDSSDQAHGLQGFSLSKN